MRGRVGRGDERCGEKIMNAGDASWAPHSLCFTTTRGAALERRVYTCQFCRGFSIDFIQDPPFEAIVEHEESDEHENNVQAARLRVLPGYIEPLQMLDLLMKGRWLFTDRWYSFWEKAREPFDVALSRLFMLVAYESSNSGSELPTAISPEELYTEKLLEVFDKFGMWSDGRVYFVCSSVRSLTLSCECLNL